MGFLKKAEHGDYSKYTGGCRCDLCRRASRDYKRKLMADKRDVASNSIPVVEEKFLEADEGDVGWFQKALCRNGDVNVFFPIAVGDCKPKYGPALLVCSDCEVKRECLDYAVRTNQRDGVWGMTTPHERKVQRRLLQEAEQCG